MRLWWTTVALWEIQTHGRQEEQQHAAHFLGMNGSLNPSLWEKPSSLVPPRTIQERGVKLFGYFSWKIKHQTRLKVNFWGRKKTCTFWISRSLEPKKSLDPNIPSLIPLKHFLWEQPKLWLLQDLTLLGILHPSHAIKATTQSLKNKHLTKTTTK